MSGPQGPQDPRTPYHSGATPPTNPQQPQPGYGYPQGQYPPPVQPGYPYEVRPGTPEAARPFVPSPNEPDWSAMADQNEAQRRRRRKVILTSAAVVIAVVAAAAAVVVTLTLNRGKDDKGTTADHQQPVSAPASPTKTASPKSSGGDPAPTVQGHDLFKATTLPINGHSFERKNTSHETPCWKATQGGLGPVLDTNHCSQVLLATYVSDKDSVTVGVLAFPTATEASAVAARFEGRLLPLTGKTGIPDFCNKVDCAVTHAVHGRYVYTTVAGPNSGAAGDKDPDAVAAGQGIAAYTLSRLLETP